MRGMRDSEDINIVGHGPCSWDVDGQGGRHFWSRCYAKSIDTYINPRSKISCFEEGQGFLKAHVCGGTDWVNSPDLHSLQ